MSHIIESKLIFLPTLIFLFGFVGANITKMQETRDTVKGNILYLSNTYCSNIVLIRRQNLHQTQDTQTRKEIKSSYTSAFL